MTPTPATKRPRCVECGARPRPYVAVDLKPCACGAWLCSPECADQHGAHYCEQEAEDAAYWRHWYAQSDRV